MEIVHDFGPYIPCYFVPDRSDRGAKLLLRIIYNFCKASHRFCIVSAMIRAKGRAALDACSPATLCQLPAMLHGYQMHSSRPVTEKQRNGCQKPGYEARGSQENASNPVKHCAA